MMLTYERFMKHAEKITKAARDDKPELKGVFHSPDGLLYVTDGHRAYRAKGLHDRTDGVVLKPKTLKNVLGVYPQVHRFFPNNAGKEEVILNVRELKKFANIVVSTSENWTVEFRDDCLYHDYGDNQSFSFSLNRGLLETSVVSAIYLHEAMQLFDNCRFSEVTMSYYGQLQPLLFSAESLDVIILPVRIGFV